MPPNRTSVMRALKDRLFGRTHPPADPILPSFVPAEVHAWIQAETDAGRTPDLARNWQWEPTPEGRPRSGPLLNWAVGKHDLPLVSQLLALGALQQLPRDPNRTTDAVVNFLFMVVLGGPPAHRLSLTSALLDAGAVATLEAVRWAVWNTAYDPFLLLLNQCSLSPNAGRDLARTAHQVGADDRFIERLVEAGGRFENDDLQYNIAFTNSASAHADARRDRWVCLQTATIMKAAMPPAAQAPPPHRPRM